LSGTKQLYLAQVVSGNKTNPGTVGIFQEQSVNIDLYPTCIWFCPVLSYFVCMAYLLLGASCDLKIVSNTGVFAFRATSVLQNTFTFQTI
jgi:hypothetical protein